MGVTCPPSRPVQATGAGGERLQGLEPTPGVAALAAPGALCQIMPPLRGAGYSRPLCRLAMPR